MISYLVPGRRLHLVRYALYLHLVGAFRYIYRPWGLLFAVEASGGIDFHVAGWCYVSFIRTVFAVGNDARTVVLDY